MKKRPNPRLYKVIFETRYKPDLSFYENYISAARQLTGYPDWETDRLRVILKNFKNHCSVAITFKSFSYTQDSENRSLEKNNMQNLLKSLPSALNISSFLRYGYRNKYIIPVNMPFHSLVSIFELKFHSQNDKMNNFLIGKVKDVGYSFDFEEKPFSYHLRIGPMKQNQMKSFLEFNKKYHLSAETEVADYEKILKSYPQIGIYADIDVYQESENLEASTALTFVNKAREKSKIIINNINDYILE